MPEITIKDIKEIVQKDIKELLQKDIKEIVQDELKKGLLPINKDMSEVKKSLKGLKRQISDLGGKVDRVSNLVVNMSVDLQDVPANIEEILKKQRHTETNIDWLAAYHKNEEAGEAVNFRLIEKHKEAIMLVAERTDKYTHEKVKNIINL